MTTFEPATSPRFAASTFFARSRACVPGPPLADLVRGVSPIPLLLISADWGIERKANRRDRGAAYERRIVGFFDRALVSRS